MSADNMIGDRKCTWCGSSIYGRGGSKCPHPHNQVRGETPLDARRYLAFLRGFKADCRNLTDDADAAFDFIDRWQRAADLVLAGGTLGAVPDNSPVEWPIETN